MPFGRETMIQAQGGEVRDDYFGEDPLRSNWSSTSDGRSTAPSSPQSAGGGYPASDASTRAQSAIACGPWTCSQRCFVIAGAILTLTEERVWVVCARCEPPGVARCGVGKYTINLPSRVIHHTYVLTACLRLQQPVPHLALGSLEHGEVSRPVSPAAAVSGHQRAIPYDAQRQDAQHLLQFGSDGDDDGL